MNYGIFINIIINGHHGCQRAREKKVEIIHYSNRIRAHFCKISLAPQFCISHFSTSEIFALGIFFYCHSLSLSDEFRDQIYLNREILTKADNNKYCELASRLEADNGDYRFSYSRIYLIESPVAPKKKVSMPRFLNDTETGIQCRAPALL